MSAESDAVKTVAGLMALAARTAPKAVGLDSITVEILSRKDQEKIAEQMVRIAAETGREFFRINAEQVRDSDCTVLIGVTGKKGLGLNCGGCGYATCSEMVEAGKTAKDEPTDFKGPNCVFKVSDLGIATGSAVKTAGIHNVDNRVMYSAAVAAMKLGFLKKCSMGYAIPLKASGKNIFFDVRVKH
jgi:uncharacterized ferredoxin-like protein